MDTKGVVDYIASKISAAYPDHTNHLEAGLFEEDKLSFEQCLLCFEEVINTEDRHGHRLWMYLFYTRLYAG